jgi:Tfp pilus assembly protein PilV
MKKKFFNMIEVLLALGVTAIGIMGIMAVIPVTLNANRDASADNLIADVANTKFAEIAFDAKKNFTSLQSYPASKPGTVDSWTPVDNVTGLLTDGNMTDDGIQFSGTKFAMGRSGKAPELTGDILLWKTAPGDVVGVSDNSSSPILIRVYMEVSWPSSSPYEQRKKRVYVREFLDPASSLVREPGT